MKHEGIKHVALALTLALSAVSCGSGSSNLAEGGIGGTGISMGTVTGFGSIWVNGVHFETVHTKVYKDGKLFVTNADGTDIGSMLGIGMVVTVKGTINADGVTGRASSVNYADNLEGPINGAPTANSFVVLGQTVIVDNKTVYKGVANLNGLGTGNVVEVSGFRDANGDIHATYIEKKADSFVDGAGVIELKGTISAVDWGTYTIRIGTQVVDITNASQTIFSVYPAVNDFVEVKGSSFDISGKLIADSVELESTLLDTEDHDEAEMEGIVTRLISATEFVLGGQTVRHDAGTQISGGPATDIGAGKKLEVEGSLAGGVLIAKEISFEDGN